MGQKLVRHCLAQKISGKGGFTPENIAYIRGYLLKTSITQTQAALEYLSTKPGDIYQDLGKLFQESIDSKFGEAFKFISNCLGAEKDFCVLTRFLREISDKEFKLKVLSESVRTLGLNLDSLKKKVQETQHNKLFQLLNKVPQKEEVTTVEIIEEIPNCYCFHILGKTIDQIGDLVTSLSGEDGSLLALSE